MTNFLVDHNLGGHTEILLGSLASQGWLELLSIRFFTFKEMNLSIDSSDRIVWRFAQENQLLQSKVVLSDAPYRT